MNCQLQKSNRQSGFTLLELLMVITIIGILMSMSFVVMLGFLETAEVEATSATIQKLSRLMEQRTEAFERAFTGVRKQQTMLAMRKLLADPNLDLDQTDGIFGVYDEAVEILAKKALFRFEMPQRFSERLLFGDPGTIVAGLPNSIYRAIAAPRARTVLGLPTTTDLTNAAIVSEVGAKWANHNPLTESAELLYFSLFASGSYGSSSVDADRFTDLEIRDTDNDGLPEIVDAWDQPLRFYRWPTRLIDWNPPSPFQPNLANVSDPTDVLMNIDTDNDNIPDTTIGQRVITGDQRAVAGILLKGLPPLPSAFPNGVLPRDLLLTDPDDPVGTLYSELERLNGLNGFPLLAAEFNEAEYHTPDTFHAPLIVSAGPDKAIGLYEPNDTANLGNLAAYNTDLNGNGTRGEVADFAAMLDLITDNITSRNKIAGTR